MLGLFRVFFLHDLSVFSCFQYLKQPIVSIRRQDFCQNKFLFSFCIGASNENSCKNITGDDGLFGDEGTANNGYNVDQIVEEETHHHLQQIAFSSGTELTNDDVINNNHVINNNYKNGNGDDYQLKDIPVGEFDVNSGGFEVPDGEFPINDGKFEATGGDFEDRNLKHNELNNNYDQNSQFDENEFKDYGDEDFEGEGSGVESDGGEF